LDQVSTAEFGTPFGDHVHLDNRDEPVDLIARCSDRGSGVGYRRASSRLSADYPLSSDT